MTKNEQFKVCTRCFTYNQAQYIEDALNGFCIQQTNFPVVYVIVDDASTDGEPEVIKRYLAEYFDTDNQAIARREEADGYQLIFAQHKTNNNCFFAVLFLKYNHYHLRKLKFEYIKEWHEQAEYIALNEGDDYWIDPLKLQKQADFMDSHPQHSLCFCAHKELLPSGSFEDVLRYDKEIEECPMEDIILGGGGYMATNSMFYRNSMNVPYSTWAIGCPIGDLPMMLTLAARGKVGYLSDIMCVYRISAVGSWSEMMRSSFKKRRTHYKAILKMWHQFDKWSGRQYHRFVSEKIRLNRNNYYKSVLAYIKNKLF